MNIFSLLTKYAAGRKQLENQCTLSLVALLQYYPEFLLHFANAFYPIHKRTINNIEQIAIKPHPSIRIRNGDNVHPDLLLEYQGKPLIVFEMKVESRMAGHQYQYGKQLKCPLVLITKHLQDSCKNLSVINLTWHYIGKISEDFLCCNGRLKKSGFLSEFILFLREIKMYLPESIVTKGNFQYFAKLFCSKTDKKSMSRGLQESIELFGWLTSFLNIGYERLCVNHPWMRTLDSTTKFYDDCIHNAEDFEKEEANSGMQCAMCNDRIIQIYRYICKWNRTVDAGIQYGWHFDTIDNKWYFYTSHYYGSKTKGEPKKFVPKADSSYNHWARSYREYFHYYEKFIPSRMQPYKAISIWEKEIDKIGKWFSESSLADKVKQIRRR
jgi:hypothetical protein